VCAPLQPQLLLLAKQGEAHELHHFALPFPLAPASCLQLLPMHRMKLFSTLAGGAYARLSVGTPCAMGSGTVWAGNLLKPMLGRGELRCIGATTIAEYRKYIEKVILAIHHRGSVFTSCTQK